MTHVSKYHPTTNPLEKMFYDSGFPSAVFDSLLSKVGNSATSFPPYDIISEVNKEDKTYRVVISMALAGFEKDEINIEQKSNILTISSEGKSKKKDVQYVYIQKGISKRAFENKFKLSQHAKVTSATMENGMLDISIDFTVPEEMKANKISIK